MHGQAAYPVERELDHLVCEVRQLAALREARLARRTLELAADPLPKCRKLLEHGQQLRRHILRSAARVSLAERHLVCGRRTLKPALPMPALPMPAAPMPALPMPALRMPAAPMFAGQCWRGAEEFADWLRTRNRLAPSVLGLPTPDDVLCCA